MKSLAELRETRAARLAEMQGLVNTAGGAGRDLSEQEAARFDQLKSEVRAVEAQINRAEFLADAERQANAEPVGGRDLQREARMFNVAKATAETLGNGLTGREAEVSAELSRGREVRGFMAPSDLFFGPRENRNFHTASDGTTGGFLVPSTVRDPADRFRPSLMVEAMGAMVLRGLVGSQSLPVLAGSGTAYMIDPDTTNTTRSKVQFEAVNMMPRTVSAEYAISRRLLINAAPAEAILRRDIGLLLTTKMDEVALRGNGSISGVLGTPGVPKVTTGVTLSLTAADLMFELDNANVTATGRGFLTSPKVMQACRKTLDADGHVIPLAEVFHNARVETSTQVPDNLSTNKSGLIFGEWSELVVGYWSGVDLLPNPYHSDVSSKGGVVLHAFLDFDAAIRRAEAFAYAEI